MTVKRDDNPLNKFATKLEEQGLKEKMNSKAEGPQRGKAPIPVNNPKSGAGTTGSGRGGSSSAGSGNTGIGGRDSSGSGGLGE